MASYYNTSLPSQSESQSVLGENNVPLYLSSSIKLSRKVYESKEARDFLDEEFKEFLPQMRTVNEFFDIYNNKFYSVLKSTHQYFIEESLKYIIEWTNPLNETIDNLNEELKNIQIEIDSVERFHPIFPNGIVISPDQNTNFEQLENNEVYYMMSGKARPIEGPNKENLFGLIKARHRSQHMPNSEYIISLNSNIIEYIERGKIIQTQNDLSDSFYELNTYNPTTNDI